MPHHDWSERDFDWVGLDDAINIVSNHCSKWGRLGGQTKEKFGTMRFYTSFGNISLHTLLYPRYVYNQLPPWLWKLDLDYIGPTLQFFFERMFVWWQKKVYNRAYQVALKAHPNLREEILVDADYPELIDGGMEVHSKYWKKV